MPKPAKFNYTVGQSVRFRFYDGSVHGGKIQSMGYRNEDVDYLPTEYSQPMYTCHVPDSSGRYSRGYMVYTVSENMIKTELDSPINIKALKDQPKVETVTPILQDEVTESLDDAIAKQKQFLNR